MHAKNENAAKDRRYSTKPQMSITRVDLTEGSIFSALLGQFLPLLFGLSVFAGVAVADGYFVSRLGTDALAVFALLTPFILLGTAFLLGFSHGVVSSVARAIGRKDHDEAAFAATISYALILPFAALYLVVSLASGHAVFRLLGGTADHLAIFDSYLHVWVAAVAVACFQYVGTSALRGRGMAGAASVMQAVAALVNLAFDPVLMFGLAGFPKLGLQGAAVAAFIGFFVGGAGSFIYLLHKGCLGVRSERWAWQIRDITSVSLYSMLTNCVQPLGRFLVLAIVARFGTATVAAISVLFVIDRFMLNIFIAIASALAPFVGQNWGARRYDRVWSGASLALASGALIGFAAWILLLVFSDQIGTAFSRDAAVSGLIAGGLKFYPLYITCTAVVLVATAAFNASGNPAFATIFVTLGQLGTIPLSGYFGGLLMEYLGIIVGISIGQAIVAGFCATFLFAMISARTREPDPGGLVAGRSARS